MLLGLYLLTLIHIERDMTSFLMNTERGAEFSECRTWRYALWRLWSREPAVMFIGLNPSTADETQDDPTIRRCINFAKDWGYGGIYMLNLFAFRATNPKDMRDSTDPIGPGNNEALSYYRSKCGLIVAAWGADKHIKKRGSFVIENCIGRRVECLDFTKDKHPKHPLYVRGDVTRKLFWEPNPITRGKHG